MKLHLGVIEVPYTNGAPGPKRIRKGRSRRKRAPKPNGGSSGAQTTGDVAEILEAKYHVMETFYDHHEEEIADLFAEGVAGAIEDLVGGAPAHQVDPFAQAAADTEAAFKKYLETEEIADYGVPGVPTKAALQGKSKRFKKGRGPRRPSFIDTGIYENSAKVWMEK